VCSDDASDIREELREEIKGMIAPSATSRRICSEMNALPPNGFARFDDKIGKALKYVDRMEIDVKISARRRAVLRRYSGCKKEHGELTGNVARYKARVRHEKRKKEKDQRNKYKKILHRIALQHKPFYQYSTKHRTDRIFPYNNSALMLPSEVRDILCEGLYDVDLKSAHLYIAAWLWGAEGALETLTQEGYSVWDDLMEHCRPLFEKQGLEVPREGMKLYEDVKAGMKVMIYSIVYGMPAPSMQAKVTKTLKPILGPDVGEHLRTHSLIQQMLEARDEKLQGMKPGDVIKCPSGLRIKVEKEYKEEDPEGEDLVGPKTAMAALAQSYEQELMTVLLDVAEEREEFQPLLWLHDGTACRARHLNALQNDVDAALQEKREELTEFAGKDMTIPAVFEIEEIEAPDLPPRNVGDRIASAGGGAVRLKGGETAVRVDEETGEELSQAGQLLLKHEHEFYKVGKTYIQVTDDGYEVASDPFPTDKLWQKLDKDGSDDNSTSSEAETEDKPPEEKSADGAGGPLRKKGQSHDSVGSTAGASNDSPDWAESRPPRPRQKTSSESPKQTTGATSHDGRRSVIARVGTRRKSDPRP
jgi:hypothetical protein